MEQGLHHVSYAYPGGGVLAVNDLDLQIPRGRHIGIIGPSGCGKSTILGLLAGLIQPSQGSVARDGASAGRHPLAMVFQKDTLLPWLTVRENVRLFHRLRRGKPSAQDEAFIDELLELAGLTQFVGFFPRALSGGMRKRVQILAAVAARPEILLLDEPFSSLDEPTRISLHQYVLRITEQVGMTMVLVTHDLAEAISISDEVVILTHRPAHVYTTHTVPFGKERDVMGLREQPQFLELYAKLWSDLSLQIQQGQKQLHSAEEASA